MGFNVKFCAFWNDFKTLKEYNPDFIVLPKPIYAKINFYNIKRKGINIIIINTEDTPQDKKYVMRINLVPNLHFYWNQKQVDIESNQPKLKNTCKKIIGPSRLDFFHEKFKVLNNSLRNILIKNFDLKNGLNLKFQDIKPFLPIEDSVIREKEINIHYLGYYLKWTPQEVYYYAVENTGFKTRPFRTQGTYSKYNSIDDKIDDLHYYTTHVKFGIGRATYDASQEIRNNHINRDEGVALVNRFDGEFPDRYFSEIMEYLEIEEEHFHNLCDKFRSPHLWEKRGEGWELRKPVSKEND